jgi:carboxypeptidase Taq
MSSAEEAYKQVCAHAREIAILNSIDSLMGWDERVLLPPAGGEFRADQVTFLAGQIHTRWTDPRFAEWLAQLAASPLAADPHSDTGATIRQLKRKATKKTKLPKALVEEQARLAILGQQKWVEARKADDFASFRPLLERIVALKREEAQALGWEECAYDALLDDYEPDEKTSNVRRVLSGLREELTPFIEAVVATGRQPDISLLGREYPVAAQRSFSLDAAAQIGFDFQRGRLDETAHPFCSGMGPNDCRLTTRYNPHHFNEAFFGTLHEAGHGLYDQGLAAEHYGMPLGDAISLGIHESQSRMWENFVGRSRAFWDHFYAPAAKAFPGALGSVPFDTFYFAINDVRPSLIRIEADEATYNLHIIIRFELEQALINDGLPVVELPGAWRAKYKEYLGIEPPNDANGVLQDIHWSGGAIGYFATYSLGNLYAAQFFAQADRDLGGDGAGKALYSQFRKGEFQPLLGWLREKIHSQGQRYSAAQLVERVTGKPLSHEPLMAHLRAKFGPLYGVR